MVPVSLFIWLVGELSAYAALAHFGLGTPWPTAGLAAVGALFGLRAGINAVTWAYALAYPGAAPALGLGRRAAMILGEYLAFLALFVAIVPLERLWMSPDRLRPCRRPLILVHGYGCSRGAWWWLRQRLEAAGHVVATVSLAPPNASIGKLEPQLHQRIEEVCAATGADRVVLVGHSMGGLVCRCYLTRHGNARVAGMVTIASPHRGSEMARIALGQNARELEPGSRWLQDQAREPVTVPAVAICNRHDNYVMPPESQSLEGAETIDLDGIGHLALLYSSRAALAVLAAVGAPE